MLFYLLVSFSSILSSANNCEGNDKCAATIRSSSVLQASRGRSTLRPAGDFYAKTCVQNRTCQVVNECRYWKPTGGFWVSHISVTEKNEEHCGNSSITDGAICGRYNATDGSKCGWVTTGTPPEHFPPQPRCNETTDNDCIASCGAPRQDPLGTFTSDPLPSLVFFPKKVGYKCSTQGAFFEGKVNGTNTYEMVCQKDGTFTNAGKRCEMVQCGEPPMYEGATRAAGAMSWRDEIEYHCNPGTSCDGTRTGRQEWNMSCTESGITPLTCTKCLQLTSCGVAREDPLASFDHVEVYFPETVAYNCSRGSTLEGILKGATTYDLECQEDGTFKHTRKKCEKVRCGEPPVYVGASRSDGVRFWQDEVQYVCNPGTSSDGTRTGRVEWNISCTESGFAQPTYNQCVPLTKCGTPPEDPSASFPHVDFYFPETVTYNCTRGSTFEGTANGATTYDLQCQEDGTFKNAGTKCEKVRCGEPPVYAGASRPDGARFWLDEVQYSCDPGTSSDGTRNGEVEWNISCIESGFTQPRYSHCVPLTNCGTPREDPSASFSHVEVYFPETITYNCTRGSTLDGIANGATTYDLECQEDGTFKHANKKCEKVSCGEPPQYVGASRASGVRFAFDQVHYMCEERHVTEDGLMEWNISCTEDGTYTLGSATECTVTPSCGSPPRHPHATSPTDDVFFPDTVTYTCDSEYTLDGNVGGASTYQLECKHDGTFKNANTKCHPSFVADGSWTVAGSAKDATNTRAIAGARIHVVNSDGTSVDVVTDASGKYSVEDIPSGVTTFRVEADGYVTAENEIVVTDDIEASGRRGDFFLSPHAGSTGDWRIVLRWGERPRDLDSHLYFSGNTVGCHVYYGSKEKKCEGAVATLDTDDRNGIGPETITVTNTDGMSSTLLYTVVWYADATPNVLLDRSEAQVDIYRGDTHLAKMEINFHGYQTDVKHWHVARLNPSTGRVFACTNEQCE